MLDFKDQVVIVTGSSSTKGIGRATAITFARQGAMTIVTGTNEAGINETVEIIKNEGGKAEGMKLDVTSKESVDALVKTIIDKYGRIDVLVNNAGICQKVTVEDMTLADMEKIFQVNLFGLFLITQACVKEMKKVKYGRVVSLSSVAGKRGGGFFGGAHYSASKAAILAFSKNLAREVAADGITVNCVTPGPIYTDIWKTISKEDEERIIASIPMGRIGETQEVANAIVFLASKEASFITGEDININGGIHMD